MRQKISESAVRRLSVYLRLLRTLEQEGEELVSSRELARRSGATSAQVRKDFSLFGSFGKRGQGYDVRELTVRLEEIFGLRRRWSVCLVGVGKIGAALLGYGDLSERGFDVVAGFDVSEEKIGSRVHGVPVFALEELERIVRTRQVEIGIIATPPEAAQEAADRLSAAGVSGVLNFAPVEVTVPRDVALRTMDVVLELEALCYLLTSDGRSESKASA